MKELPEWPEKEISSMSLRSLTLQNFQAHKSLEVPLDPGITVILGATNSGKSSVFRALRWLVEHKPATGLLTHGQDSMSVSIETDSSTVSRFKTPKDYGYSVNDSTYLACATVQPADVRQALGLAEINLQGQHDPPFLLTLTPGQMARELNRIVDLSVIDKANSEAASRFLKAKNAVSALEDIETKQVAQEQALAWVSQADLDLQDLESLVAKIERSVQRRVDLLELSRDIGEASATIISLSEAISDLEDLAEGLGQIHTKALRLNQLTQADVALAKVQSDLSDLNACGKALASLRGPANEIQSRKERLAALRPVLLQAETSVEVSEEFSLGIESLLSQIAKIVDTKKRSKDLEALLLELADWQGNFREADSQEQHWKKLLEQKQMEQKVCPTCKRPI